MTANTLLEASHELITAGMVATLEKTTTTTDSEKDTPMFRKKLQRVLGVRFIATKKDQNLRPLIILPKRGIGRQSKRHMDHIGIILKTGCASGGTAYS